MALPGFSVIGLAPTKPAKLSGVSLALPPNVRNDVFVGNMLEMPSTKHIRRSPLEWAGAAVFHGAIIAVLILVPLYTTGTITLGNFDDTPLIAPPPPPPPAPAGAAVAPHPVNVHTRVVYKLPKIVAPTAIPKKIASISDAGSAAPPNLAGVDGGVAGGVVGGQVGGGFDGAFGGTRPAPPPPPPPAVKPVQPTPKLVRVGSNLKAPRQTKFVQPDYPPLARQTRLSGTVLVDAIIDEDGNVVQARAIRGNPLLIPSALRAVLQWKYEPTTLGGHPVSVELQVNVNFNAAQAQE